MCGFISCFHKIGLMRLSIVVFLKRKRKETQPHLFSPSSFCVSSWDNQRTSSSCFVSSIQGAIKLPHKIITNPLKLVFRFFNRLKKQNLKIPNSTLSPPYLPVKTQITPNPQILPLSRIPFFFFVGDMMLAKLLLRKCQWCRRNCCGCPNLFLLARVSLLCSWCYNEWRVVVVVAIVLLLSFVASRYWGSRCRAATAA